MNSSHQNHNRSIGAIVLAAGASSRLGRPKQLVRFDGQSLLRRTIITALEAGCAPIVVVLGAHEPQMKAEIDDLQVLVTHNVQWNEGLSTSVRAGIEALSVYDVNRDVNAAIFLPCDQPLLSCDVLEKIIETHRDGAAIVVCEYADTWGAPMLFERELWPQLQVLAGDRGAQKVARDNAERVQTIPFPNGAFDIDTEDDYRRLMKHL